MSDLVLFPLLLKYGGMYADVGMMQIGDLDRLWRETVGDPVSRFKIFSYNVGGVEGCNLINYSLPVVGKICFLLELWAEDVEKTSTDWERMHSSPLLEGVLLIRDSFMIEEEGRSISPQEIDRMLVDYVIQGQAMGLVMGLVNEEDDWNGPKYVAEHVYSIDHLVGPQLIDDMTRWDRKKAFYLMLLSLLKEGEVASADQKQAREIVKACLQKSFACKSAHGLILRMFGETSGSLWRKHVGLDDVPETHAHWLRHGTLYWNPDGIGIRTIFRLLISRWSSRLRGARC